MILPVQRLVHDAIAGAIRQQYGLTDLPTIRHRGAADPIAGRSRCSGRVSARAPASQTAESHRPGDGGRGRPGAGCRAYRRRAERLPERVSGAVRLPDRPAAPRRDDAPRLVAQDHRRAHGDQSQQGRAYRASPQRRARRYARPGPPLSRRAGRSAELHRRSRRPGGRYRRRVSPARESLARSGAAPSPTPRVSTTTAGTCTRGSPNGTATIRNGSRYARRRCTTWSAGRTRPPPSPRSSSIASCRPISARCAVSASAMTC